VLLRRLRKPLEGAVLFPDTRPCMLLMERRRCGAEEGKASRYPTAARRGDAAL
jgi:hypothetical protein